MDSKRVWDAKESIRKQQDLRASKLLVHQEQLLSLERLKCTFRPELCGPLAHGDRPPVVVCGLDRFYELKGLKEQRDLEQKAYEEKVFRRCLKGPPTGITIPEPRNEVKIKKKMKEIKIRISMNKYE